MPVRPACRIDHAAPAGIGLSDLVLVRRVEPVAAFDTTDPMQFEGRRVVPELAPLIGVSAEPSFYFVVYPNAKNPANAEITVELGSMARCSTNRPALFLSGASQSGQEQVESHHSTRKRNCGTGLEYAVETNTRGAGSCKVV